MNDVKKLIEADSKNFNLIINRSLNNDKMDDKILKINEISIQNSFKILN